MKIAIIICRVLLGLMFFVFSLMFFLKLMPQPELTGKMKEFMEGMVVSGYIMQVVKAIELICGLAFITGFFAPLATVVIFPIVVNIVCVHLFLAPEGLPMAIVILALNLFLAYAYRDRYAPMLKAR